MQGVEGGGQLTLRIQLLGNTGVEQALFRLTLLPVAVYIHPGQRCDGTGVAPYAISLNGGLAVIITAAIKAQPGTGGQIIATGGGDIQHATGGIAILHRGRAPNNLNTLGGIQVNGIDLRLAIRQGVGNAIHLNADTANTEGRASPETPGRESQILGEVVTVLEEQARHGIEGFVQLQALLALADGGGIDYRYGSRGLVQIPNQTRR